MTLYSCLKYHHRSAGFSIFILLIILVLLLSSACKKDIPPELKCDLTHPGQICREDAFRRGKFLGYIEYYYLGNNQLYQKKYFSTENSYLEETFEYNHKNLLVYQKNVDKDGNTTEEKLIDHNDFDSVATVTIIRNGVPAVFTACEYDSLKRLLIQYDYENDHLQKTVFKYGDDGKLFSETIFNQNNDIVSYSLYKSYQNNISKIFHYNGYDELLSSEVKVYDINGNLLEIRKYNKEGLLKNQETFLYVNNKLMKHGWLTGDFETEFRLFHYP